jgi:hypothetical protein
MGKKTPQAPTPPDPVKTAQAQAAINKETAITQSTLNRVDEYTPYGTSKWAQAGTEAAGGPGKPRTDFSERDFNVDAYYEANPDVKASAGYGPGQTSGAYNHWKTYGKNEGRQGGFSENQYRLEDPNDLSRRWSRINTLDPDQQDILDKQNTVTKELNQVAADQVGRVGDSLADPFSYEGISPAGSTTGATAAAGRVADISNQPYDYSGQRAAPSARGITDSADIAARSVSSPFSFSGQAPSTSGVANAAQMGANAVSTPFALQGRGPGTAGISGAADRAEAGMAQRFNYDGLPAGSTAAGSQAAVQRATDAYGTPLNYDGAPAAPEANAAARQQVIDSLYQQQTSRLDPRFEGELIQKETQLANSGIARGSAAFSASMDDFYRGRNDAYQGAQNAAIQAGGAEQSRLFGLGSAARQNAIAEQNYLRASAGQEQGQLLGFEGQLAGAQDRARGRGAQERLATREVGLDESERLQALRGRQFSAEGQARDRSVQEQLINRDRPLAEAERLQGMRSNQFGVESAARDRSTSEELTLRGLPAQEQAQIQAMRGAAFDAQGRERSRGIGEQDSLRNRGLTEQQANYNMQAGLFGLDQSARQRAIEESAYLRNLPLNETSALMSGNQIMNPTFGSASPTAVANTDYSGLVQNQYQGQLNNYNQQVAANNSRRGGMASMLGTLGSAAITSDRRVKQNISKVGTLDNGLPVYSFQYIWGGPQQIGLMAQDVEKVNPSAVSEDENGIKGVNYSEAVK